MKVQTDQNTIILLPGVMSQALSTEPFLKCHCHSQGASEEQDRKLVFTLKFFPACLSVARLRKPAFIRSVEKPPSKPKFSNHIFV